MEGQDNNDNYNIEMKTNKSYSKRLKVTRTGKLLAKKAGGSHFNAKKPREKQLQQKRWRAFTMKPKVQGRFLPHS